MKALININKPILFLLTMGQPPGQSPGQPSESFKPNGYDTFIPNRNTVNGQSMRDLYNRNVPNNRNNVTSGKGTSEKNKKKKTNHLH